MADEPPVVTIILPVLNEVESIDACLTTLAGQDYAGQVEILVAEGGSTDGTRARLVDWALKLPSLRVIDNPKRLQSFGLNSLATNARGEILMRADGHTTYAPNYVRQSVQTLQRTGAMVVGGLMTPVGSGRLTRAVAEAMTSPWAIGPARFRHATEESEADAVYLGTMLRSDFLALGGFRTFPTGVAEDADFFYRIRRGGGRVVLDPLIISHYQPRTGWGGLFRQFRRYGQGKAEMFWLNGEFPSWRPLAPLALVILITVVVTASIAGGNYWPVVVLAGTWLAASLLVFSAYGRMAPAVSGVAAVMQVAYGLGLAWGLVRGPGPVRGLRSAAVGGVEPPGRTPADQSDRDP